MTNKPKRLSYSTASKPNRAVAVAMTVLAAGSLSAFTPAWSQQPPRQQKVVTGKDGRSYVANQLLIQTGKGANKGEVDEILKDVKGTVVKEIKGPTMTFLVIEVPEGTLDKTEQKLSKDKHFSTVQRNYTATIH